MVFHKLNVSCALLLLILSSSVIQTLAEVSYQEMMQRRAALGGTACTVASKYGYPCETHYATTSDGWKLTIHRVPTGKTHNRTRGVVLFQHGLTDDSAGATLNPPGTGLIWYLADMGYDVWLGNNRGNGVSMTNSHYTSSQDGFWDFSWSDMAEFDVPATIDYVTTFTKQSKIAYIGHSEGTIQAFAGFSSNHVVANKVSVFIALAPIAFVNHVQVLLLQAMAALRTEKIFQILGMHEFWIPTAIHALLPNMCWLVTWICDFVLMAVSGPFPGIDSHAVPFWLDYEPNPTSVKNMAHWSQSIRDGTFGRYDYGESGNMQHYGQRYPPQYNLTNWPSNLPVALFAGSKDYLGDPRDVQTLTSLLPQPYVHYEPDFGHLDFILGKYTSRTFPFILQFLQEYNVYSP